MSDITYARDAWLGLVDDAGMPSAVLVYDRLRQSLTLARREPIAVTLMLLSWDVMVDTRSESAAVDMAVAERVRSAVRSSDTVGWLAPGELAVMLPNANDGDVPFVASRLMVRLIDAVEVGGESVLVRPYAGVTVAANSGRMPEVEEFHAQAAQALVDARQRGGGFAAFESAASRKLMDSIQRSA
jgi:Diguanylate cyclase, GGDEF domain